MLHDKAINAAQPKDKDYKLSDGYGLHLLVKTNGSKLWRMKYRFGGKEKTLSFGPYPLVTLRDARDKVFEARKLLSEGVDPGELKKAAKAEAAAVVETVELVAREWFDKFSPQWVEGHSSKIIRRLERDLFPYLGKSPIQEIKPAVLLTVLRRVESRGALETAHRLLNNCGQVWRYAVATGRIERDITVDLKGALAPAQGRHLGAITEPRDIGALLRCICEFRGSAVVRLALQLAPLVFVRPGELRQAKWCEIDLEKREWVIPAEKMKGRRPHVVPLSTQAMAVIEELKLVSADSEYLFPSPQSKTRCLSDAAMLVALRRMGYSKDEMSAHGFRAMASTNLEQLGYDVRLIELQLAHADSNEVRAAYKRDLSRLQIAQRSQMMQHWADYLDGLRHEEKVVPFRRVA